MTPRICLNMIVKNEAAILERCLASAAPHISCYVIADTGSTDGTQDLIRRFFDARGIPGEIVEFPFVNFAQARNGALDAARASSLEFDYILLFDADMELVVTSPPLADKLTAPAYGVMQYTAGGLEYANVRIVRRDCPCRYKGVTHEVLDCGGTIWDDSFTAAHFIDHACGSSRTVKLPRDIALLVEGLKNEPDNARYMFYLANSYREEGQLDEAVRWYRRRIEAGGWREEVYISEDRIAQYYLKTGRETEFFHQCLKTFEAFPDRAETIYRLAHECMLTRRHHLGYHFAQIGLGVPKPGPMSLFIETSVYTWRLLDIAAVCGYWIGRHRESLEMNERLLGLVPEDQRARILDNLGYCRKALT